MKAVQSDAPVPIVSLPGSSAEINLEASLDVLTIDDEKDDDEYVSPEQLSTDLITMSSLANSRWQNLLNIDIVKKRNKPKEAPKAPEAAPFFLPTIPALDVQFDLSQAQTAEENSKMLVHPDFENLTKFGKHLQKSIKTEDFTESIGYLKSLGPSSIDLEIQSLSLDLKYSQPLMLQYMKMISHMMVAKKDFELAQAYLSVFLKVHGTMIAEKKQLWKYLAELQVVQSNSWSALREKLFYNLSVVQHLKKM